MTQRICSNCVFVEHTTFGLLCAWKRKTMPPPVHRQESWGKRPPETTDQTALRCPQFKEPERPKFYVRRMR